MQSHVLETGDILAVDGKAMRGTSKNGEPHSALQILTAYLVESGIVLGQASIEYQSDVIYGPVIKAIAVDLYSEGAVSNDRICEFINAISSNKLNLSKGSIYGFCQAFVQKSEDSIAQIYEELMNVKTVYTDSTGVTINGKQAHIRNQSIDNAVLYSPMNKKDIDTL